MFHPFIMYEIGKARYHELLQAAEQYRQARKFSSGRTYSLPVWSSSFTSRKPEETGAVSIQTR